MTLALLSSFWSDWELSKVINCLVGKSAVAHLFCRHLLHLARIILGCRRTLLINLNSLSITKETTGTNNIYACTIRPCPFVDFPVWDRRITSLCAPPTVTQIPHSLWLEWTRWGRQRRRHRGLVLKALRGNKMTRLFQMNEWLLLMLQSLISPKSWRKTPMVQSLSSKSPPIPLHPVSNISLGPLHLWNLYEKE